MSFACFGLSIAAISNTISTYEGSHSWAKALGTKSIFQNYSQLLDICTRLVLKTAEELILPSVHLMALRTSKQLPSGWQQLTPAWPLTHRCITLWSGVPSAKFGGHRAFLKNLTSGWPRLTPAWSLTQQWVTLWAKDLPTTFGGHTAFLSNLTSGWPWLTPAWPLTPAMHYALVRGSSH